MNIWATVRAGLIAAGFVLASVTNAAAAPREGVTLTILAAVFSFGMVAMLFVIGMQRINPRSAPTWRYPSWTVNPFSLQEPLQFFHLGGFFFLATGAGAALYQLLHGQELGLANLFLPAFGAGILVGVYACTFAYRGKMERT